MGELPSVLAVAPAVPLVARVDDLEALERIWAAVEAGERRIVLLAGEPGAGKTRLAAELARAAHAQGATVLFAGAPEAAPVPYGPLRDLVAAATADRPEAAARLAPRLGPLLDRTDPGAEREQVPEPYVLARGLVELLRDVRGDGALLVVVDDLHWVDPATAAVLDQLARGEGPERCAVVVTHRVAPGDVTDAARSLLAGWRRRPDAERIAVRPLDEAGVRDWVAAAAGHPFHIGLQRVADHLVAETGGNPFLLGELWRQLVDTGQLVRPRGRWRLEGPLGDRPTPAGIRDVVGERLEALPDGTCDALRIAAAIGEAADVELLAAALGRDVPEVLEELEPAHACGLLVGDDLGSVRFAHALTRRAVLDATTARERGSVHLAVARALQDLLARGRARTGSEVALAHHLIAAVPLVGRDEAVAAVRAAAVAADRAHRPADAAAVLGAAEPLVDRDVDRLALLLDLADARTRAGDVRGAQEAAVLAHELGSRLGDADAVVASAMAYDEANWRAALPGETSRQLVEAALAVAEAPEDRRRLRAARARALAFSGRDAEARDAAEEVLAEAADAGDALGWRTAATALLFTSWTPRTVGRLAALADELVEQAVARGEVEEELWALDKAVFGDLIRGDLAAVRRRAARHHQLAVQVGQPLFRMLDELLRSVLAVGEGRVDDAERHAAAARDLEAELSGRDSSGAYGVQMFAIRRAQGRLAEERPALEAIAASGDPTWAPALAVFAAEVGLVDDATRVLDRVAADRLASVPDDALRPAALVYLADAAALVGHRAVAEVVRDELAPWSGLVLPAGQFLAAFGAADRYLGVLDGMLGRPGAAERFDAALRLETTAAMPAWIVQTQAAYGSHLAASDDPEEVRRGATMLRFAADGARRAGMVAVEARARAAMGGLPPRSGGSRAPAATDLTDRELAVLRLLVEGRSNRQIGEALHISHHTAANHVRAILLKAGCANRTEAASWALRHGLAGD